MASLEEQKLNKLLDKGLTAESNMYLPLPYQNYPYFNPALGGYAPERYGQGWWADVTDTWTLGWQGAVQYNIQNMPDNHEITDWNPLDEKMNPNRLDGYEQYADELLMTNNREHFDYLKGRIDEKRRASSNLQWSDRWSPSLLVGLANPMYLVPLPATLGMGILGGFARGALGLGAVVGAEEALYHAADPTRTWKESTMTIGTAALMGGALGGVLGAVGKGRYKKGFIDETGKRIDREHARREGRMPDNPWNHPDVKIFHNASDKGNIKVKKNKMNIDKTRKVFTFKETWKFAESVFETVGKKIKGQKRQKKLSSINVDVAKIMQQWKEGIRFWTNPIAMGTKNVFKHDTLKTPLEAIQFIIEREAAKTFVPRKSILKLVGKGETRKIIKVADKIPDGWKVISKVIDPVTKKASVMTIMRKGKYIEKKEPFSDWITRVNKTALERVNAFAVGDSSYVGVITREFAKDLTKRTSRGLFNLADSMGIDKLFSKMTPWYRAINIVKTKFRGDNYLGSKPWELGYTGVDHNGKFFRIRKPADVKAMGEAQNKFAQFNEIFEDAYAMFVNAQKRMAPFGVELSNAFTNISNKVNGVTWFKDILNKSPSQWTKSDFEEIFFLQLIEPSFLKGKDAFKVITEAVGKTRVLLDDTGKVMSDLGMFASNKGAKVYKNKLSNNLFTLENRLRAYEKQLNALDKAWQVGAKVPQKKWDNLSANIKQIKDDIKEIQNRIKETDDFILNSKEMGYKDLKENYFPQMWSHSAITQYPEQFKSMLRKYFQDNDTYWKDGVKIILDTSAKREARVNEIFHDIAKGASLGDVDGLMAHVYRKKGIGGLQYLKHRVINIKQTELFFLNEAGEKVWFINRSVSDVLRAYWTRTSPQIAMAQKFGDRHMFGEIQRIRQHILEDYIVPIVSKIEKEVAKTKPNLKEIAKLEKEITKYQNAGEDFIQNIKDLRDKTLMQFNRADPTAWSEQVATSIKDWASMATMGRVYLTALIDNGMLIFNHGYRRAFGGAAKQFVRGLETSRKARRQLQDEYGEGFDVLLAQAGSRFQETGGNIVPATNIITRTLSAMQRPFYIANLLGPHTVIAKQMASHIATQRLLKNAVLWARGKPVPKDEMEFMTRFFDLKFAKAIEREFKKGNIQVDKNKNWWANSTKWSDDDLSLAFRSYVNDSVHSTVITPKGADRPNWFDAKMTIPTFTRDATGKMNRIEIDSKLVTLPAQFLSYGMSATSKLLMAGMQRRDGNVLSGVTALMALGYFSAWLKDPYFEKKTFTENTIRAFELTGMLGIINDLNISIETLSANQLGVRPAFGARPLFGDTNIGDRVGEPFGPGINLITEAIWAFTSEEAKKDDRAAIVRRLIPWNNLLIWNSWFRDASKNMYGTIEESITD